MIFGPLGAGGDSGGLRVIETGTTGSAGLSGGSITLSSPAEFVFASREGTAYLTFRGMERNRAYIWLSEDGLTFRWNYDNMPYMAIGY